MLILSHQTITITVQAFQHDFFCTSLFCVHCNINSHLQRNTMFCLLNDCQFLRELACPELLLSVWVARHSYVRSSAEEKQSRCTKLLSHIDFVNTKFGDMDNSWNAQLLRLSQRVGKSRIISLFHTSPPSLLLCSRPPSGRNSPSTRVRICSSFFFFFLATVTTCLLWSVLVMQSALKLMDHNVPRIKL